MSCSGEMLRYDIEHRLRRQLTTDILTLRHELTTAMQHLAGSVLLQLMATGKRVRNTYAIYPKLMNSPPKGGLIHRNLIERHRFVSIAPAVLDGRAPE